MDAPPLDLAPVPVPEPLGRFADPFAELPQVLLQRPVVRFTGPEDSLHTRPRVLGGVHPGNHLEDEGLAIPLNGHLDPFALRRPSEQGPQSLLGQ